MGSLLTGGTSATLFPGLLPELAQELKHRLEEGAAAPAWAGLLPMLMGVPRREEVEVFGVGNMLQIMAFSESEGVGGGPNSSPSAARGPDLAGGA
mmetsp:Transcript_20355/g.44391  ORF Transcript_20355/g.44391 Transcript_20355/m.44391 type:complete len:95 (+) Transcript_20355:540-824(+)